MKLTRLQKIFEELQFAQNEQGGFGSTTPYSMLIEEMLKDSPSDFCLAIAEKAIKISRQNTPDAPLLMATPPARRGRRPKTLEAVDG